MNTTTRRQWLAGLAAAPLAAAAPRREFTVCAFSKHFQWTDVAGAARVCAELGYDGMDLTVRPGGHVLPERVADDLPRAAEAVRAAGLKLAMITSPIVDVSTPHAEAMVKAMRATGVRYYRWGPFRYDLNRPLPPQLAGFRERVRELAELNRRYGVCAIYHTHSGEGQVGASQWDLYRLLEGQDSDSVAVNYDIGHATVEGGFGGWVHSARLMLPLAQGVAVKDFRWGQDAKGAWVPQWCALGTGMVDFKRFFAMLKDSRFAGPLQLHMEHPALGGANDGHAKLDISREQLIQVMRRDSDALQRMLDEAGL